MKNVNIMRIHQFLGERGHKKAIYMGNCLKSGAWAIAGGLAKNREQRVFEGGGGDTSMHTMTYFCYMLEFKIGLANVSTLNFDQSSCSLMQRKK